MRVREVRRKVDRSLIGRLPAWKRKFSSVKRPLHKGFSLMLLFHLDNIWEASINLSGSSFLLLVQNARKINTYFFYRYMRILGCFYFPAALQ